MHSEILMRANELKNQTIETIYFGGGTPSVLTAEEIHAFFDVLTDHIDLSTVREITLEANPDDLTINKLSELKDTPINRLSIGVQSFFEQDLQWMNRAHNAKQAKDCLRNALQIGFENITMDLIYGSPTTTDQMWQHNIAYWLALDLPHLSAYCLTVEENTALAKQIESGQTQSPKDEKAIRQFDILMDFADKHGIEQYEISNFARAHQYALHNSSYWFGQAYIGIGPSAHSFDGLASRRYNIAHNIHYCNAIEDQTVCWEEEKLTPTNRINEYLLTRVRTKWGVKKADFVSAFGQSNWQTLQKRLQQGQQKGYLYQNDTAYLLTRRGKHIADRVISELFF